MAPTPIPSHPTPDLRVSDRERDDVADQLRRHAGEGRLDPEELSERLEGAYAARTRKELSALTADLPRLDPGPRAVVKHRRDLGRHVAAFVVVNLFLIAIWAASGAGYFWPIWPLLGWGLGLASHGSERFLGRPLSPCGHRSRRHPGWITS
jgi:hypothetical protein